MSVDAAGLVAARAPTAMAVYAARRGWALPVRIPRVHDSSAAVELFKLGWCPNTTFEAMLADGTGAAEEGRY